MPRTKRVSDSSLVRRSQQGDRRAFRTLLSRYDWRLRGLAHALLLEPAHIDAALRIAYIRAWRDVVRIDAKDDAAAWLYRVAYNACIDGLRRDGARTDVRHDGDATPEGSQRGVVSALASLTPADRVALVLVDREEFTPQAAARILGLTTEVLETRLAAARSRVAKQLGLGRAAPPSAPVDEPEAEVAPDTEPDAADTDEAPKPADGAPDTEADDTEADEPEADESEMDDESEADESEADESETDDDTDEAPDTPAKVRSNGADSAVGGSTT
jgi:RNA polymerase sigma-70 factor (ECF subfamily)